MKAQLHKNIFQISPVHTVIRLSEIQLIRAEVTPVRIILLNGVNTLKSNESIVSNHTSRDESALAF
jgi:hypothetical protein